MDRASVPSRFAIFPLPNVVLFPDTRLPLHIFEPRYRAMTADALAGNRVIGMVLIRPGGDPRQRRAPIFGVGCAGTIVESRRLHDGRYHLLLEGVRRFRIRDELDEERPYRTVGAELLDDPAFDALDGRQRAALEELRTALVARVLELSRGAGGERVAALRERMSGLDPVELVHALAFGVDCGVTEKQGLLETPTPLERGELLRELLDFRLAELKLPATSRNLN